MGGAHVPGRAVRAPACNGVRNAHHVLEADSWRACDAQHATGEAGARTGLGRSSSSKSRVSSVPFSYSAPQGYSGGTNNGTREGYQGVLRVQLCSPTAQRKPNASPCTRVCVRVDGTCTERLLASPISSCLTWASFRCPTATCAHVTPSLHHAIQEPRKLASGLLCARVLSRTCHV